MTLRFKNPTNILEYSYMEFTESENCKLDFLCYTKDYSNNTVTITQ